MKNTDTPKKYWTTERKLEFNTEITGAILKYYLNQTDALVIITDGANEIIYGKGENIKSGREGPRHTGIENAVGLVNQDQSLSAHSGKNLANSALCYNYFFREKLTRVKFNAAYCFAFCIFKSCDESVYLGVHRSDNSDIKAHFNLSYTQNRFLYF